MTAASRPDYAREIRCALTDVRAVCESLGLLSTRGSFVRQHGGLMIRCPWHDEHTPSCSVRIAKDQTIGIRCHGCGATGDVLSLVAIARGFSLRRDFRQVLLAAAEMAGLWAMVHELETGTPNTERPHVASPPRECTMERDYPPSSDVDALWNLCGPVTGDDEARALLLARGLDPELVDHGELARVLPKNARAPRWAAYRGRSWTETGHRLLVRMRDAAGLVRTLRGWRVAPGDSPKRLPPGGHKASGVVLADELAVAMLSGAIRVDRVVVVEGESDWLTWATRRKSLPTATLGIVSGSWTPALADRFPFGATVIVRTDHDDAGDRYARDVHEGLRRRCFVRRGGMR